MITLTHIDKRIVSSGDAMIWLSPIANDAGADHAQAVMTVTSTGGETFEIILSSTELEQVADTADAILSANQDEIDNWFTAAAHDLHAYWKRSGGYTELAAQQRYVNSA